MSENGARGTVSLCLISVLLKIRYVNLRHGAEILQALACSHSHTSLGVLCYNGLYTRYVGYQLVKTEKQASAACEDDAVIENISDKLGRCLLYDPAYRLDNE